MRLIDADALKQTFCAECNHSIKCNDCDIDYHFNHAPTVEPKHGHWKSWYHGEWFSYSCDQCGYGGVLEKTRYCPYCGAKMDEVTDE